jgi:exoribonuclease R
VKGWPPEQPGKSRGFLAAALRARLPCRVGKTFSGNVSAVVPFGSFIALDDIFIEGLVHISDLGRDCFHFDEARHELAGAGARGETPGPGKRKGKRRG